MMEQEQPLLLEAELFLLIDVRCRGGGGTGGAGCCRHQRRLLVTAVLLVLLFCCSGILFLTVLGMVNVVGAVEFNCRASLSFPRFGLMHAAEADNRLYATAYMLTEKVRCQ
jgi:hypothetical protein